MDPAGVEPAVSCTLEQQNFAMHACCHYTKGPDKKNCVGKFYNLNIQNLRAYQDNAVSP